jgi:cell wall-associated NlpC family hydrolase
MKTFFLYTLTFLLACGRPNQPVQSSEYDTSVTLVHTQELPAYADSVVVDSLVKKTTDHVINTRNVRPEAIVNFAYTLKGVPYKYTSTNPAEGFDCSGFITYVFNHFKIEVPRSSVDFTNVGKEVTTQDARAGDLILFTGTDSSIRIVGHMGIVTQNNNGELEFIHSTSGKAYGVTTTPLNGYYKGRFVKITRVFPM